MTIPVFPAGLASTTVDDITDFKRLPPGLQGMQTHVVYISPAGDVFDLAGPHRGRQGVRLATALLGDQQWPANQVVTNSPYTLGATIERQNVSERKFSLGIIIGDHAPQMTEYQYRMAEARWWAGQDERQDGWLGVYTRYSGWRWCPVRPDAPSGSAQYMDPTAYGNNSSSWDITWLAARPYFTKPALYGTWDARTADGLPTPAPTTRVSGLLDRLVQDNYYWGSIPLANRGDLPSYATFFVSSPGQAILQDNDSRRLVPMPETVNAVGTYMVDTEPAKRTLTAANDPHDNLVFDFIRQSQILKFFLGGVANSGVPLQLTWADRFIYEIPPRTAVQLTVGHTNPTAVITAVVPQRYKRSR